MPTQGVQRWGLREGPGVRQERRAPLDYSSRRCTFSRKAPPPGVSSPSGQGLQGPATLTTSSW